MKKNLSILLFITFGMLVAGSVSYNYVSAVTGDIGPLNLAVSAVFFAGIAVVVTLAARYGKLPVAAAVCVYTTALATVALLMLCTDSIAEPQTSSICDRVTDSFLTALAYSPMLGLCGVYPELNLVYPGAVLSAGLLCVYSLSAAVYLASDSSRRAGLFAASGTVITLSTALSGRRFIALILSGVASSSREAPDFSVTALIMCVLMFAAWALIVAFAYFYRSRGTLAAAAAIQITGFLTALMLTYLSDVVIGGTPFTALLALPGLLTLAPYAGASALMLPVAMCGTASLGAASLLLLAKDSQRDSRRLYK